MERSEHRPRRKTGRPLSFNREAALQKAMLLFWQYGYEATTLSDLTATMGVTPPSIYTAFGDKKQLFREAVKLYLSGGPQILQQTIQEAPTALSAAERLMRSAAIGFTGTETPSGCLLATSVISCSPDASDIQAELAAIRKGIEQTLRERIETAVTSGELAENADSVALAGLVMTVIQGMSTLARDGATREKLLSIVELTMKTGLTQIAIHPDRVIDEIVGTSVITSEKRL